MTVADLNNSIAGYEVVLIPHADMSLLHKDDIEESCQPQHINILNHCCSNLTV